MKHFFLHFAYYLFIFLFSTLTRFYFVFLGGGEGRREMSFEGGRIFMRSGNVFVPKVALSILQARFLVKCRGHYSVSTSRAVP